MATKRTPQRNHEHDIQHINASAADASWEQRLSAIEVIQTLIRDLPTEEIIEHLVYVLDQLSSDRKWEVRKAAIPALVDIGHPSAKIIVERLVGDENQWVRQAAARAKRKLSRITSPAEKRDKRAQYAFELLKDFKGIESRDQIYEAAQRIGEKYYEELAGDTAHELNTYRAAVEGLFGELEQYIPSGNGMSSDVTEILAKIRERHRYLKTLVTGLLDYAKETELEFQAHALKPMVSEALGLAKDKSREHIGDMDVVESINISDNLELEACRPRIIQALTNIISNALEALEGKGPDARLEIMAVTKGAGWLNLKVNDNGCGMDSSQVDNAKKRFRSLKKERRGIGLGLPLALKIIEREHGGRLDIESELETGTTITVELPIKREPTE